MRSFILLCLCFFHHAVLWAMPLGRSTESPVDVIEVAAPLVPEGATDEKDVPVKASTDITSPVKVEHSSEVSRDAGDDRSSKKSIVFRSLAQMDEMIDLGVPALALSLLENEQDKRAAFSADWYTYEYKRIILLAALERWQELLDRTDWMLATAVDEKHITQKIRLWFETQQVIAKLQLKQSDQALAQLQRLIWLSREDQRDGSLPAVWRRLVIRSYLQLHLDDDARKALVKYEQDFTADDDDIDWLLLQVQVMLRTHRPEQALEVLARIKLEDAADIDALKYIALLQARPKDARKINQTMREKLDGTVLSRPARWAYSFVAYQATKLLHERSQQIANLEAMLSLKIRYPVLVEGYQVSADELWELYNQQGLAIANDNGLLFGNDEQWQALSDRLINKNPDQALALNAALVLHTKNVETRRRQHTAIVEIIEQRKNGLELINQLYLHSERVPDVSVLPDEVRYRLVDHALAQGDYSEAAKLMSSLEEPPAGDTLFDWRMRKARVLVLQAEYQRSVDLIRQTFKEKKTITREELDRYIQVVFDFQTVQQHEKALQLFELVSLDGLDEKLRRELFFWEAESYFALKQYDKAALYYLESARAVVAASDDLWAQSARFKAGQALVLSGIYSDAEKVYKDLLAITASDARKALIKQNLQKINLLRSADRNKHSANTDSSRLRSVK